LYSKVKNDPTFLPKIEDSVMQSLNQQNNQREAYGLMNKELLGQLDTNSSL